MKTLILAAGYGTRLYPLTLDKPKALLPINDRPIINYLLDKLKAASELDEIVVITNSRFYKEFDRWKKNNKDFQKTIRIVDDGTNTPDDRLGSIGDVDFVLKKDSIKDDIMVMGGDNLFDFGLDEYISSSHKNSPGVTVGLFDIHDKEQAKLYGVVELNAEKKINSFEEKPKEPKSTLISMCLYYFPKDTLHFFPEYISQKERADTSGGYIRWLASKESIYGFSFTGKWYDIGSMEAYDQAQEDFRK